MKEGWIKKLINAENLKVQGKNEKNNKVSKWNNWKFQMSPTYPQLI
jgi:hypothetical protein